jgi:hypothetical protein
MSFAVLFSFLIIACNNKESKNDDEDVEYSKWPVRPEDTLSVVDTSKGLYAGVITEIKPLIMKASDVKNALKKDPSVTKKYEFNKTIFRFQFLFTPTGLKIQLKGYPSKKHKSYGEGATPIILEETMGTPLIFSNDEYVLGNNDLSAKAIEDIVGNIPGDVYLKFTPRVNGQKQVYFRVTRCKSDGSALMLASGEKVTLDLYDTKPSPPAPPEP